MKVICDLDGTRGEQVLLAVLEIRWTGAEASEPMELEQDQPMEVVDFGRILAKQNMWGYIVNT